MLPEPINQVVLIDDNAIDLFVQRRFIEGSSFARGIKEYQSPVEALKYFSDQDGGLPELIFLDLNMPEMDGFSFLENFNKLTRPELKPIRVIILTSSSSEQDRERASNFENVVGFLSKPLTAKSLGELRLQLAER